MSEEDLFYCELLSSLSPIYMCGVELGLINDKAFRTSEQFYNRFFILVSKKVSRID